MLSKRQSYGLNHTLMVATSSSCRKCRHSGINSHDSMSDWDFAFTEIRQEPKQVKWLRPVSSY